MGSKSPTAAKKGDKMSMRSYVKLLMSNYFIIVRPHFKHGYLSVCLSVCLFVSVLCTGVRCAQTVEPIEMPFGGCHVGSTNYMLDGVQITLREGSLLRVYVLAHRDVTTVGECACPAHATGYCIRCREGVTKSRCDLLPN